MHTTTNEGVKNAVYGSDLSTGQILLLAERNTTKARTEQMEHLLFHRIEQLDSLKGHLCEDSRRLLTKPERRLLIQRHFQAGKTIVFWNTSNGMTYQLFGM